jgi:hypothetical protein
MGYTGERKGEVKFIPRSREEKRKRVFSLDQLLIFISLPIVWCGPGKKSDP